MQVAPDALPVGRPDLLGFLDRQRVPVHVPGFEGRVTNFQLLPPTGIQKAESFVVAGTRFKYAGAVATAGFTQMRSEGGPMRDGLQVRIHHLQGEIARLEIAAATP